LPRGFYNPEDLRRSEKVLKKTNFVSKNARTGKIPLGYDVKGGGSSCLSGTGIPVKREDPGFIIRFPL